jgi:HTH-type transcriptional regulator / antitoxin HipB
LSERLWQSQQAGVRVWIDRLTAEIAEYDKLQQGESVFKISSLTELSIALIKARIASGMTQKELAEKIGVKEQQIQRYEANHYESASFERLREVFEALGISFKEIIMEIEGVYGSPEAKLEVIRRKFFTRNAIKLHLDKNMLVQQLPSNDHQ